ncbi:hypothetical protein NE237_013011 [Protea cynaroides]|uniref:Uncharacterized protein n=1 Tax=Protea cynaroides TaxID=273540 RepID=A0A9Q0H0X2_9MAGN|nr:hypothetical protein NE237_013011 [Protea cynaroides]
MTSKAASTALFLMLNIIFFTLISSQYSPNWPANLEAFTNCAVGYSVAACCDQLSDLNDLGCINCICTYIQDNYLDPSDLSAMLQWRKGREQRVGSGFAEATVSTTVGITDGVGGGLQLVAMMHAMLSHVGEEALRVVCMHQINCHSHISVDQGSKGGAGIRISGQFADQSVISHVAIFPAGFEPVRVSAVGLGVEDHQKSFLGFLFEESQVQLFAGNGLVKG